MGCAQAEFEQLWADAEVRRTPNVAGAKKRISQATSKRPAAPMPPPTHIVTTT